MFVAGVPMLFLTGLMAGLSIPIALIVNLGHCAPLPLISAVPATLEGEALGTASRSGLEFRSRPKGQNDFIFSVDAEEKGFLGSVTIITFYSLILISGIRIASQARDRLGKILAIGVVTVLFSHLFINIGINIRSMPVTSIPLPLWSYSGSSVVCSLIAIGILQKYIYRRSHRI
jgi:rod shape determining protein RodA